jgi:competence protein ComEA
MNNPLTSLTHRERLGLVVAATTLLLFGAGSTLWRAQSAPLQPTTATVFPAGARTLPSSLAPSPSPGPKTTPTPRPVISLVVYVSGAVKKPGVYSLTKGARLYHALQKAEGFKPGAQEDALNLAGYLEDADQVHVPLKATAPSQTLPTAQQAPRSAQGRVLGKSVLAPKAATGSTTSPSPSGEKFHAPGDGKVKLNAATTEELQKLPGVGPSTAQSILDYRQAHGAFKELEEIKEVRGIGEKKFAKMEPFLSL